MAIKFPIKAFHSVADTFSIFLLSHTITSDLVKMQYLCSKKKTMITVKRFCHVDREISVNFTPEILNLIFFSLFLTKISS